MKYEFLDEYLLSKKGVSKDYKAEWGWHRYKINDKLFCAIMKIGDKYDEKYKNKEVANLKCEVLKAELLQKEYKDIMPAFYMDKKLWISVDLNGNLKEEFLKELIDESYTLVFNKLTKKAQKEILENS